MSHSGLHDDIDVERGEGMEIEPLNSVDGDAMESLGTFGLILESFLT